jgi:hypothetical protein
MRGNTIMGVERLQPESRKDLRYEVLDYALVFGSEDHEPVRSVIVDIGLGGVQIRSRASLPVGSVCMLNIGNLDSAPISIRGEVRHSQPVVGSDLFATGIKFMPETHDEKSTVAQYVHSVFQRQSDLFQ